VKKRAVIVFFILVVLLCGCSAQKAEPGSGLSSGSTPQEETADALSGFEQEAETPEEAAPQIKNQNGDKPGQPETKEDPPAESGGSQTAEKPPEAEKGNDASDKAAASADKEPDGADAQGGDVINLSVKKSDGSYLLSESTASISEGESVLSVLIRVGREKNVPVVYSGGKKSGYVEGIGGLFEFDEGPESGWVYSVNGERPGKSSGLYPLKNGDDVVWEYILKIEDGLK